ncbi:MAG: hypothetical protein MSH49_01220, partial [[Eubacterium] saphenum]|nr:hypothetical protein [[Eubacterium] saphenum]
MTSSQKRKSATTAKSRSNQADSTWTAISATNGADSSKIFTNKTENGGFQVSIGGTAYDAAKLAANVVVDTTKLGNGDTITLTFNNPASGIDAPTNAGAVVSDATSFTEGTIKASEVDQTVAINSTNVTDATMTEDYQSLFEQLNGA